MSYTYTHIYTQKKCKAVLQIHLKEIKNNYFLTGKRLEQAFYKGEYPNGQENI